METEKNKKGGDERRRTTGRASGPFGTRSGQMTITEFDNEMARKEHTDLAEA